MYTVGNPQGKKPIGRPRRMWEVNIKMVLIRIGLGNMDWIHMAQDTDQWRVTLNIVTNIRVPQTTGKLFSG
jgi:hypothetical protein